MTRLLKVAVHRAAVAALLLWAAACDDPAPADTVEIVGGVTPCVGCSIQLGPALELRVESGGGALTVAPLDITTDASGRYWVASLNQLVRVYNADGSFLKVIGSHPPIPDSFGSATALLPLPGDSMLLFNYENERKQAFVVDSQFRAVRVLALPDFVLPASASGWPGRVVVSGLIQNPASEGWTLHALNAEKPELPLIRSFGNDKAAGALHRTMYTYPRVATASDSTLWAADIGRYRISHYAKDGTLIGTIERTPDWFSKPSPDNMGTPGTPPPPKLFGVWPSPDGLLWVFAHVAGKEWQKAWPVMAPGAQVVDVNRLAFDKMYGTVIEVIDPVTRNVLSTQQLDDYVADVLPNGTVAVFARDSSGVPHLAIRRLTLAR